MTWLSATDPLALLALQTQIPTPTKDTTATASSPLDSNQRAAVIGEPVPIVFARRRNSAGGVLLAPPATECRFANNSTNVLTTSYLLVLGEGQMDGLQVRDVFQGPCRVGSFSQTYNRRAGTWTPGNLITNVNTPYQRRYTTQAFPSDWYTYSRRSDIPVTWKSAVLTSPTADPTQNGSWTYPDATGILDNFATYDLPATSYKIPDATYQCGSVGFYPNITTLSFQVVTADGIDTWKKQVHCFVRGGLWVTRLEDNTLGPSDSFADLVQWLLQRTSKVPAALIDTTAFTKADLFLRVNGLTCNGIIKEAANLPDFITNWARYFLLCQTTSQGKTGLRPLLPINNDGTINTSVITPAWVFDESSIVPGSVEISYTNLADRLPFVVQVIWRQQLENDFGIIRTAEIRYDGTATNGPYETHDLSLLVTKEAHAVKVGAYILSKRINVSHVIKFKCSPEGHNATLTPGDIIRVRLRREASTFETTLHDFFYQVERITKTAAGDVSYEATHFPVDAELKSAVAMDVANVQPTGVLLTSSLSGVSCDVNSSSSTTVPPETHTPGDSSVGSGNNSVGTGEVIMNYGGSSLGLGGGTGDGSGSPSLPAPGGNSSDGLGNGTHTGPPTVNSDNNGNPQTLSVDPIYTCPAGQTTTYKWFVNGVYQPDFNNNEIVAPYYMSIEANGGKYEVYAETYCDGKKTYSTRVIEVPISTGTLTARGQVRTPLPKHPADHSSGPYAICPENGNYYGHGCTNVGEVIMVLQGNGNPSDPYWYYTLPLDQAAFVAAWGAGAVFDVQQVYRNDTWVTVAS